MHLTPNGFVAGRDREPFFPLSLHKILEYLTCMLVHAHFESVFVAPLGVIYYF
jgi:hypothetical protein